MRKRSHTQHFVTAMSTETLLGGNKYNVVYEQSTPEIYDEWAKDGYDAAIAQNPATGSVAAVLVRLVSGTGLVALDAGCGTGLVVEACRAALGNEISLTCDGIDYSAGMLEVAAKKGQYRKLFQADLTKPLEELADASYQCVLSSGTFLQGHIGPEALPELCRVLCTGGFMVFSVRPTFFEEKRDDFLSTLELNGMRDIVVDMLPYAKGKGDGDEPMLAPIVSCTKAGS